MSRFNRFIRHISSIFMPILVGVCAVFSDFTLKAAPLLDQQTGQLNAQKINRALDNQFSDKQLLDKQNFVKFDLGSEHAFNAPLKIVKTTSGQMWFFYKDHLLLQDGTQQQTVSFSKYIKKKTADSVRIVAVELRHGMFFSVEKSLFFIPFDTLDVEPVAFEGDLYIMSLSETANGTLWVVTLNDIFQSPNLQTPFTKLAIPQLVPRAKNNRLNALQSMTLADNKILVSTALSSIFSIEQTKTNDFVFNVFGFKKQQKFDAIYQVALKGDRLYLGAKTGLYWFNLIDGSQRKLAVSGGLSYIRDMSINNNTVWFAANGVMYKTDVDFKNLQSLSQQSNFPFSLDSTTTQTLYTDNEQNTWLSFEGKGLYQYSNSNNKLTGFTFVNSPLNEQPISIVNLTDNATLLVSPSQSYITNIDQTIEQTIDTSILSFDSVNEDEFWYGARNRLVHSKNGEILTDTSTELRDVVSVVGQGNNAWYARDIGGLYFYDSSKNTHTSITNTSRAQYFIVKAPNGDLISVNSDNIERIDTKPLKENTVKNRVIDQFSTPSLIQDFEHTPIDVRHDANQITVFFDTGDIGLYDLLSEQYQTLNFAPATTQCVAHVNNSPYWWLAQQDGTLVRYNQNSAQSDRFGRKDGLPLGGVNGQYCGVFAGNVVFSTERGFFKPNALLNDSNTLTPQSALYFARSNEAQSLVTDNEIKQIEHDQFPLTFRVTNSSYQNISQNQTLYKIVGVAGAKNQWQSLPHGTNHLELPHLAQGNYRFIAQVSNNDGVFSAPNQLDFTVLPPLWLAWWAKIAYVFGLVLLSVSFYLYRTRAMRNRALLLEKTIAQKTAQIVQEKQTIEKLLSLKEQEFIHVSHELRTPLTLVTGPIKSAYAKSQNDEVKKDLAMAARNGDRLHRMVDQLLHLERFKFTTVLAKSPQNIAYILTTITESFSIYAGKKQIGITLFTSMPSAQPYTMAFVPDAFEKILVNLLSNAVKYTSKGGTVAVKALVNTDNSFTLSIADSGIGIKCDDLQHIFDKFYRVTDQSSERETGAGVGLALVKELVATHEGIIDLKSDYGVGTNISITFPATLVITDSQGVAAVNEELINHEINSLGISGVAIQSLQQIDSDTNLMSLLIIEDNPDMQQYVVSIMSKTYHCYCAANGQLGINKALEIVPDLIICDVMMPVMDGFEATKQLKENELTAHIPIILLTARGDKDSRLTGWKSLADDYIAKPFDEEELQLRATNLIAIRTILRQRFTTKILQGETLSSNDENALNEKDSLFIEKVTDIINTHLHDELYSVEQLSEQVFMSERQLQRKLKALIDFTPREFVQHLRLLKAEALLLKGQRVADVSDATGFSSSSYFARCFKAKYNMTPKQFSQGR